MTDSPRTKTLIDKRNAFERELDEATGELDSLAKQYRKAIVDDVEEERLNAIRTDQAHIEDRIERLEIKVAAAINEVEKSRERDQAEQDQRVAKKLHSIHRKRSDIAADIAAAVASLHDAWNAYRQYDDAIIGFVRDGYLNSWVADSTNDAIHSYILLGLERIGILEKTPRVGILDGKTIEDLCREENDKLLQAFED